MKQQKRDLFVARLVLCELALIVYSLHKTILIEGKLNVKFRNIVCM